MRKNRKTIWTLCLVLALGLMLLSACGGGQEPWNVEITIPVKLYFANEEYIVKGDETLPKTVEIDSKITVKETDNVYLALMDALREPPEGGMSTMITEDIRFRDIYLSPDDREMIVVDLYPEGLSSGSLGEALFIRQVVDTLLGSGIIHKSGDEEWELTKVQFLVNGEKTESLMGHFDATEPFTKEKPGE